MESLDPASGPRQFARTVIQNEADAVTSQLAALDEDFDRAAHALLRCKGHVVVTGLGKTGIIGQKISATLASTGTPSIFLHATEAYHGDLGRVGKDDLVLAISNSGETVELVRLVPSLRKIGATIVSITGSHASPLAKLSDIVLDTGKIPEACPLGLAPSASTTAILALGDALALTVQKMRGFDAEQYAFYHPGGDLGRRLQRVEDVMRHGERNAVVPPDAFLKDAMLAVTKARAGAAIVADRDGRFLGIFTDGDLRRQFDRGTDPGKIRVGDVMTKTATTIRPDRLASEAVRILKERKIDELPVVDEQGKVVGMLDVQDLLDVELV